MIWALEWRLAFAARRLFLFNVAVPLLLVAPVALSAAPRAHAAMVFTLLVAFFGTFGSAIPLVRDAESGLLGRVILSGMPATVLLPQRVAAGAALDTLQLAPSLLVIAAVGGRLSVLPALLTVSACALLAANCLGAWLAAAARSIAEGALVAAVATLFTLHASGVFRLAQPDTLAGRVEMLLPFSHLHDVMRAAIGAAAGGDAGEAFVFAAAGAAAALLFTLALAAPLAHALLRVPRH